MPLNRLALVTPSARSLPALIFVCAEETLTTATLDLAAKEVGDGRARALIRNVHHVDMRHHLEHLETQMTRRSSAGRREIELSWF